MATTGAGRGGNRGFDARGGFGYRSGFDTRSGFIARKSRNDDKAGGSDLHPPVPDRQREAVCKRDAKTCSAGASAWANFCRLGDIFDPALQRCREAKLAWFHAKEATAAEDVVAAARVSTLLEEFQLHAILCSTLIYNTLHGNEPPPSDSGFDKNSSDE
ncbi:hypothetical protein VPH35_124735 [Triticum aestivum]